MTKQMAIVTKTSMKPYVTKTCLFSAWCSFSFCLLYTFLFFRSDGEKSRWGLVLRDRKKPPQCPPPPRPMQKHKGVRMQTNTMGGLQHFGFLYRILFSL